jgi:hypothetical protein
MGAKKGLDPSRIYDVKHFFLRSQATAGLAAAPLKPNSEKLLSDSKNMQ